MHFVIISFSAFRHAFLAPQRKDHFTRYEHSIMCYTIVNSRMLIYVELSSARNAVDLRLKSRGRSLPRAEVPSTRKLLGSVPRYDCAVIRTYFRVHTSVQQSHVTNLRVLRIVTSAVKKYELM